MHDGPGYSSFAVSKRLYELSGWEGDVEWSDWLPISEKNYPAYTCGYLIRRLDWVTFGLVVTPRRGTRTDERGQTWQLNEVLYEMWAFIPSKHHMQIGSELPERTHVSEQSPEDALAQLYVAILEARGWKAGMTRRP